MKTSLFARTRRGFTLIELLIVIVIIGILAVGLVPKVIDGPKKARDTVRKKDLQSIQTALLSYSADHGGNYPSTFVGGPCMSGFASGPAIDLKPYFQGGIVPKDPQSSHTNMACSGIYYYVNFPTDRCYILGTALEGTGGNSTKSNADNQWCSGADVPTDAGDKINHYVLEKY